jgi:drug/metabolite transporter (DMT)-like permease
LLAVPVVGVLCAVIGLGEALTLQLVVALVFIVGGIAIGMSESIPRSWFGRWTSR